MGRTMALGQKAHNDELVKRAEHRIIDTIYKDIGCPYSEPFKFLSQQF